MSCDSFNSTSFRFGIRYGDVKRPLNGMYPLFLPIRVPVYDMKKEPKLIDGQNGPNKESYFLFRDKFMSKSEINKLNSGIKDFAIAIYNIRNNKDIIDNIGYMFAMESYLDYKAKSIVKQSLSVISKAYNESEESIGIINLVNSISKTVHSVIPDNVNGPVGIMYSNEVMFGYTSDSFLDNSLNETIEEFRLGYLNLVNANDEIEEKVTNVVEYEKLFLSNERPDFYGTAVHLIESGNYKVWLQNICIKDKPTSDVGKMLSIDIRSKEDSIELMYCTLLAYKIINRCIEECLTMCLPTYVHIKQKVISKDVDEDGTNRFNVMAGAGRCAGKFSVTIEPNF